MPGCCDLQVPRRPKIDDGRCRCVKKSYAEFTFKLLFPVSSLPGDAPVSLAGSLPDPEIILGPFSAHASTVPNPVVVPADLPNTCGAPICNPAICSPIYFGNVIRDDSENISLVDFDPTTGRTHKIHIRDGGLYRFHYEALVINPVGNLGTLIIQLVINDTVPALGQNVIPMVQIFPPTRLGNSIKIVALRVPDDTIIQLQTIACGNMQYEAQSSVFEIQQL
ncbi:MAG: hypothetical protein Edafosvirus3_44 [Edafosvirus sp.]|uniref:Uncharacterized protein n=1 Tax=Edafosvirus sp. TaxID=2487765 RepID=A0A3G4ZSU2_9VIRU|nr:MAG: hypothetical protein Edafosvirus3_44 [Edafosvirus sp.]